MRPHRQRFLNTFAALGALLRREARIDSDHLTASTCSLATQDSHKRAPRSIKNALCQSTARQTMNVQVFDHDGLVRIRVLLRDLEMKVTALAFDFQMGLRHTARHLATTAAALFAGAQAALLAAQGRLACPKEARVFDRMPIAIGKKDFQAHVDADRRPVISRMRHLARIRQFAHYKRIPVSIRSLNQVARLRRPLHVTVALDLDSRTELARNTEQPAIKPYILAFGKLSQLDAVPLVAAFETREAPIIVLVLQNVLKGFREAIGQTLYRGRGNRRAATTLESLVQVVSAQKRARLVILLLLARQHVVVQLARFIQPRIQAAALFSIRVQAKRIRSLTPNYIPLGTGYQTSVRIVRHAGWM